MSFDNLCKEAQDYVLRYIRGTPKTKEEALQEDIVQTVCRAYENGELQTKLQLNMEPVNCHKEREEKDYGICRNNF